MKSRTLATIVGGVAGFACAAAGLLFARNKNLHVYKAAAGPLFVYDMEGVDGKPLRIMRQGGVYQSATYTDDRRYEAPFEYLRSFDRMFEADLPISTVLMIGGGGYAYPKHLLDHHDGVDVVVAEIDPVVTEAALQHFFLYEALQRFGSDRLGITNEDGCDYLRRTERTFDVIINDAFDGAAPDNALGGVAGAKLVKQRLSEGGLYLTNVVADPESYQMQEALADLGMAFKNVYVIPCIDEDYSSEETYLLIATDGDYAFNDVLMQRMRLTEEEAEALEEQAAVEEADGEAPSTSEAADESPSASEVSDENASEQA